MSQGMENVKRNWEYECECVKEWESVEECEYVKKWESGNL